MAVARDTASAIQSFTNATSKSFSYTASGTNPYVRVGYGGGAGAPPSVSTLTYAGSNMTKIDNRSHIMSASFFGGCDLWEYINPPTGSQTIAATFVQSYGGIGATSYTGVNQTVASGTPTDDYGTGQPAGITISSNSGDMVSDQIMTDFGNTGITPTQTLAWSGIGGALYYTGASDAAGAASVTMNWTENIADDYLHIACNILQAGGGGGGPTDTYKLVFPGIGFCFAFALTALTFMKKLF